jgi:hypothetical protein
MISVQSNIIDIYPYTYNSIDAINSNDHIYTYSVRNYNSWNGYNEVSVNYIDTTNINYQIDEMFIYDTSSYNKNEINNSNNNFNIKIIDKKINVIGNTDFPELYKNILVFYRYNNLSAMESNKLYFMAKDCYSLTFNDKNIFNIEINEKMSNLILNHDIELTADDINIIVLSSKSMVGNISYDEYIKKSKYDIITSLNNYESPLMKYVGDKSYNKLINDEITKIDLYNRNIKIKVFNNTLKESDIITTRDNIAKAKKNIYKYYIEFYYKIGRSYLSDQCDTSINKITKLNVNRKYSNNNIHDINYKDIIYIYNGNIQEPFIRFSFIKNHTSILVFQNGKIIKPKFYYEGKHILKLSSVNSIEYGENGYYYIYVSINDLSLDNFMIDSIYQVMEGVKNSVTINISKNPIYTVITKNFFRENNSFKLYPLKTYIKYSSDIEYFDIHNNSINEPIELNNNTEAYIKIGDQLLLMVVDKYIDGETSKFTNRFSKEYEKVKDENEDLYREIYKPSENGEYIGLYTNNYVSLLRNSNELQLNDIMKRSLYNDKLWNKTIDNIHYRLYEYGPYVNQLNNESENMVLFNEGYTIYNDDIKTFVLNDTKLVFVKVLDGAEIKYLEIDPNTNEIKRYSKMHNKYENINNIHKKENISILNLYRKNENDEYVKYKSPKDITSYNKICKIDINVKSIFDTTEIADDSYIDTGIIYDSNGINHYNNIMKNKRYKLELFNTSNGYSDFYLNDENDNFLAYEIPYQLIGNEDKMICFLDGEYIDKYHLNQYVYYKLFKNKSIIAFPDNFISDTFEYIKDSDGKYVYDENKNKYIEYDENNKDHIDLQRYKRFVSSVFINSFGNYTLYNTLDNISIKNGVITNARKVI